jgi:ABC-type uncharacterized transport system fused permease/ATPase subunit
MPIPLTYLEMQKWIMKTTHSDPHLNLYLQRERIHVDAVPHSHSKTWRKYMDLIKKVWAEVREKPLWAVLALMVVLLLFA